MGRGDDRDRAAPRTTVRPRRPPRFLVLGCAFELPWASTALRRLGGVPAAAGNAARLLAEGHLVMTFPEGGRGRGQPATRAATASSASATAASSSSRCAAARRSCRARSWAAGRGSPTAAGARGAPAAPAAAASARRPRPRAGGSPSASRWTSTSTAPDAAEDRALVLELVDDVRARLQEKVYDSLVNREGAL